MKLFKALSHPSSHWFLTNHCRRQAGRGFHPSLEGKKRSMGRYHLNGVSALFSGIYTSSTPLTHAREPPAVAVRTTVGMGRWILPMPGPPSWWQFSGLPKPGETHSALERLLNHGLDPHFRQRHKLLLCTAVNLNIWFPLTAKLTNQLNSDIFYVLSYARFNVFQAQHSAEEFGFTGSGVNCKLFTVSIALTELGSNSCIHLSESLNSEKMNEPEAADWARQSPGAGHSLCNTFLGLWYNQWDNFTHNFLSWWSDLLYICFPDLTCLPWRAATQNNKDLHLHSTIHFSKLNNINFFIWSGEQPYDMSLTLLYRWESWFKVRMVVRGREGLELWSLGCQSSTPSRTF